MMQALEKLRQMQLLAREVEQLANAECAKSAGSLRCDWDALSWASANAGKMTKVMLMIVYAGNAGSFPIPPRLNGEHWGLPRASQPEPTPTGVEALVCQDIAARQRVGVAKYGTTLAEANVGDFGKMSNLYQELLDACIYLRHLLSSNFGDAEARTAATWANEPKKEASHE